MEHSVRELTSAIAAGDPAAFTRLYREEFDTLVGLARRASGRDEAFAMDVVQEVMVKVIRRLPVMESREQLGAWLRRVTLTTVHDALRGERRRGARERVPRGAEGERRDALELEERLAWIRSELEAMDAGAGRSLSLRVGEGRTLGAVGRMLGVSAGAVDGRVSRALRRMRERAREVFDD